MATTSDQLQALRGMKDDWDGYDAAAPLGHAIDLAQEIAALIEALLPRAAAGTLQVSPTRIGGVLIDWEDHAMQHEIEIHPDQSIGFLHLTKATGSIATRKFSPGTQVVHPGLLQELRHSVAA